MQHRYLKLPHNNLWRMNGVISHHYLYRLYIHTHTLTRHLTSCKPAPITVTIYSTQQTPLSSIHTKMNTYRILGAQASSKTLSIIYESENECDMNVWYTEHIIKYMLLSTRNRTNKLTHSRWRA